MFFQETILLDCTENKQPSIIRLWLDTVVRKHFSLSHLILHSTAIPNNPLLHSALSPHYKRISEVTVQARNMEDRVVNTITAPLATPTNEQLAMWSGQSQVDGQSLLPSPKLQPTIGIKSPVFHQFNIPSISARQADISYGPRQTYGIQLKGSSFLRRHSSLNFLRSRSERALFKKRYCHFQKIVDSADTLLPFTRHVV